MVLDAGGGEESLGEGEGEEGFVDGVAAGGKGPQGGVGFHQGGAGGGGESLRSTRL